MKHPKIIGVVNNKGGVSKTTTALHLASGLARRLKRVWLIEVDSQANLARWLPPKNLPFDTYPRTIADSLICDQPNELPIYRIVLGGELGYIYLTPASPSLNTAKSQLESRLMDRNIVLANCIKKNLETKNFDYVIIDSGPDINIMLINVLFAVDEVLIPVTTEPLSFSGLGEVTKLVNTANYMRQQQAPVINGYVITKTNTKWPQQTITARNALVSSFGSLVYETMIRSSKDIADAPLLCKDIWAYRPKSIAAIDYNKFIDEFLKRQTL